jgi:hypothetical protein
MKTCLNHEEMVAVLENMLKYVDNQWKLRHSTKDAINAVLDVYMGKTLPNYFEGKNTRQKHF